MDTNIETNSSLDMTAVATAVKHCFPVRIYTDNSKPEAPNHRLVVIDFKTPKDKKDDATYKKPVSRCVSIPTVTITVQPDIISAALNAAYCDLQDAKIRSIIVEHITKGETTPEGKMLPLSISMDEITIEAIAAYFASSSASAKLSTKLLETWFDNSLAAELEVALITALKFPDEPTADQQGKLDAAVKQHKQLIVKLASPTASLPEAIAKQLKRAVALAEPDQIQRKLVSKLDAMLAPREEVLSLGLGE
jgi:hypothetical protein